MKLGREFADYQSLKRFWNSFVYLVRLSLRLYERST